MRRLMPLALLLLALAAAPAAAQERTRVDVPAALERQVDRIVARGHGPVLLPSRLPPEHARLHPSERSTRRAYRLELSAAPGCNGATACFVAVFSARRGGTPSGAQRVRLANGRRGRFTPTRCGASCAPPRVQWRERGRLYTIRARVGTQATEKRELLRLANSAIVNGARR